MSKDNLLNHFKRIFKDSKAKVVKDLVEAIKGDKYWKAKTKDYLFLVALSRARIPYKGYYIAKATHFKRVLLRDTVAKYCRRGRILMAKKNKELIIAEKVLSWEAFVKLMKKDNKEFLEGLILNSNFQFIGKRELAHLIRVK
ncbi:hypothetical protein HRbin06_00439 [archaeon HR06]|nr:hypothetical protein HRbin06_00439 [archaeon HR06]